MALALLDTMVLVYAAYREAHLHRPAAEIVARALRERGRYCIAPQNLVEFAAVVTRARFVSRPLPGDEVARIVDTLYRSRRLAKIYPRRATVQRAVEEGSRLGVRGPAWYDLFLATTMRDAGVEVIVTENVADFRPIPFVVPRRLEDAI